MFSLHQIWETLKNFEYDTISGKHLIMDFKDYFPASEARRELANLTWRKNPNTPTYKEQIVSSLLTPVFVQGFLFPRFSQATEPEKVVFSRYRQFGKWCPVLSCLIPLETSSGTQTSTKFHLYLIIPTQLFRGFELRLVLK